jgi:phosphonate transport system ATP-binding protein
MLQIESLSKTFGDLRAVDGVTLEIPKGQMVGVIGRSGAGKSTLLRMINRLVEPTAGRIVYEGADVTALRGEALRAWRARAAMVFQTYNLIGRLDVLTNVLVGALHGRAVWSSLMKMYTADERARAILALERFGMAEAALQRADTLSGGQQQRVAIARALMQKPHLILADEPIASLDPVNSDIVMDALQKVNREDGITVLCNLHALDVARARCDRIIGMAKGKIVFDGPPSALDDAAIEKIYGGDRAALEEARKRGARPAPVEGA